MFKPVRCKFATVNFATCKLATGKYATSKFATGKFATYIIHCRTNDGCQIYRPCIPFSENFTGGKFTIITIGGKFTVGKFTAPK